MHFTPAFVAAVLALTSSNVLALPTPQLAGEGAACNSILSSTDNGVGYGIENAENNIAGNIKGAKGAKAARGLYYRQLAGEGAACNSILSSTDNGVGYGIENGEDNIAQDLGGNPSRGGGSGSGSGSAPPPKGGAPPPKGGKPAPAPKNGPKARQLDKVSNGFQAISDAAGTGSGTSALTTELDSIDGTSTGGAADAGAQIGSLEESTLEGAGNTVPKRQLDKVSNGFQAISDAAGSGDSTSALTTALDNIDGTSTGGAADAGAQIGALEESTLEGAGNAVPK